MTKITVMKADGSASDHVIEHPSSYKAIRAAVDPHLDGQTLEHVTVLFQGRRADMFVGELSADSLPRNEAATRIYRTNWMTQHPDVDPETIPAVYGPAVLFHDIVWD